MSEPGPTAGGLPCRRQLTVTWGIPDSYGGMTAALLHRARLFRRAGADVDVVTFEERSDYEVVRARLAQRGELAGGIRIRNIYEDFRTRDRAAVDVPVPPATAVRPPDQESATPEGAVRRWIADGQVVRLEHLRADGSLAVLEERAVAGAASRMVTSFDAVGRTTGQWPSARRFRFAWLDEVIGADRAVVTVDSKTAARAMQHYRHARAARVHLVHGAHLDAEGIPVASRRDVLAHLSRWDAVAFLTDRQRAAAAARFGDPGNLAVVHNSVTVPEWMPRLPPDRLHGVLVARLSSLKRIDHALRVIARVRSLGVAATAEIVGDGAERAVLEAQSSALGLTDAVRFAGYVPDAARRFADGAWTLLTSRSEGESLSLLEAMAAGCVPVAYDIDYGPAEVIRHGRNGFLVPDGSVESAAAALVSLCLSGDDGFVAMRRSARHTAQSHDDAAALARWTAVQEAALRRQKERHRRAHPGVIRRVVRGAMRRAKRLIGR